MNIYKQAYNIQTKKIIYTVILDLLKEISSIYEVKDHSPKLYSKEVIGSVPRKTNGGRDLLKLCYTINYDYEIKIGIRTAASLLPKYAFMTK